MATVTLKVNSAPGSSDWTLNGNTPYLDEQDATNYITNNGRNKSSGVFGFANSSDLGTITAVKLFTYGNSVSSNLTIVAQMNDGSTTNNYNLALTTSAGWIEIDIVGFIDTWTKINAATVNFIRPNSTVQTDVDASYIQVTYTATYIVSLTSSEDDEESSDLGTITLDSVEYGLPDSASKEAGGYIILYAEAVGYDFVSWSVSGSLTVNDEGANPATLTVSGNGTLDAIYEETAPPVNGKKWRGHFKTG